MVTYFDNKDFYWFDKDLLDKRLKINNYGLKMGQTFILYYFMEHAVTFSYAVALSSALYAISWIKN